MSAIISSNKSLFLLRWRGCVSLVRHLTCPTYQLSEYVGQVECFKRFTSHLSDISLVRHLTCPTSHIFVRNFGQVRCLAKLIFTFHIPLVRHLTCPTSHLSDTSLVRRFLNIVGQVTLRHFMETRFRSR